jgi:hypothetical protein
MAQGIDLGASYAPASGAWKVGRICSDRRHSYVIIGLLRR